MPKEPEPIVVQTAPGEILGTSPVSPLPEIEGIEDAETNADEASIATQPSVAPRKAEPKEEPAEGKVKGKGKRKRKGLRGLAGWVESRAHRVVSRVYRTQADDLEERARRVVGSAYREHSDDLEERAIRVLRSAIADEADRIKEAISHGVEVKKREVRLSLVVLIVASLMYLALYWFTETGGFD